MTFPSQGSRPGFQPGRAGAAAGLPPELGPDRTAFPSCEGPAVPRCGSEGAAPAALRGGLGPTEPSWGGLCRPERSLPVPARRRAGAVPLSGLCWAGPAERGEGRGPALAPPQSRFPAQPPAGRRRLSPQSRPELLEAPLREGRGGPWSPQRRGAGEGRGREEEAAQAGPGAGTAGSVLCRTRRGRGEGTVSRPGNPAEEGESREETASPPPFSRRSGAAAEGS